VLALPDRRRVAETVEFPVTPQPAFAREAK